MNETTLTPEQNDVLQAAIDLVNGGMDMEEALGAYSVIAKYVVNHPPHEPPTEARTS